MRLGHSKEEFVNSSYLNQRAPRLTDRHSTCLDLESPESVLRDLFDLLEEYGPSWYTEELHNRAASALEKVPGNR